MPHIDTNKGHNNDYPYSGRSAVFAALIHICDTTRFYKIPYQNIPDQGCSY